MGHYMTKEERIILQTLLNEKSRSATSPGSWAAAARRSTTRYGAGSISITTATMTSCGTRQTRDSRYMTTIRLPRAGR